MEGFFPKSCLRVGIYAEFFGSWGHYNCLSYGFTHFLDVVNYFEKDRCSNN
ncbi:hypothetical protein D0Y65_015748 [Glycine soja]|uniref:Uncharacterized protein n=1 Tax=Glycine soja TaxID=3848 RepID=A0A445KEA6_GLYSO|nr:hypothetical protein D0Y65_015748 [Glycine soja]